MPGVEGVPLGPTGRGVHDGRAAHVVEGRLGAGALDVEVLVERGHVGLLGRRARAAGPYRRVRAAPPSSKVSSRDGLQVCAPRRAPCTTGSPRMEPEVRGTRRDPSPGFTRPAAQGSSGAVDGQIESG